MGGILSLFFLWHIFPYAVKRWNPNAQNLNFAKIRTQFMWPKFGFWMIFSIQNPNQCKLDAFYALACPVGQDLAFGDQTAVHTPDDYELEASWTSENQTSLDFGDSL